MYYESLTKLYPIKKTIRNELVPIGKTLENIKKNNILEADEDRKIAYIRVKAIMDDYHKRLINEALSGFALIDLDKAANLYLSRSKSADDIESFSRFQDKLRKAIAKRLREHENFGKIGNKDIIPLLQKLSENEDDYNALESFKNFYTYFESYNDVRLNLYSDKEKSSTVAYRLINENLPRFLDNIRAYDAVQKAGITSEELSSEAQDGLFLVNTFNNVLIQDGINTYNEDIGKLNVAINLYNQKNASVQGFRKVPKMKVLYKQILSDREESFIDEFESDTELLDSLESHYANLAKYFGSNKVQLLFTALRESKGVNVYVKNDIAKTSFSNVVFGSWSRIDELINGEYDDNNNRKKDEKYYDKRQKELKKNKSYTIEKIITLSTEDVDVIGKYIEKLESDIDDIRFKGKNFYEAVLCGHDRSKKLSKNKGAVEAIKGYLDSVKDFERDLKLINGSGQELEKNLVVYGEQEAVLSELSGIDSLYNMTRNYLTKKPFSTEKIKLNFNKPTFLDGWDYGNEEAYLGFFMIKEGNYFLAVMDANWNKEFRNIPSVDKSDCYKKVIYKQISSPEKSIQNLMVIDGKTVKKNGRKEKEGIHSGENLILEELKNTYLPKKINDIRKRRSYLNGDTFSKKDLTEFIGYYKQRVIEYYNGYSFYFKSDDDYASFKEFQEDVGRQAYQISYVDVPVSFVDDLINSGKLYLFRVYNKDFSEYSKGRLNLHTLYFKMLFDERNLKNVVYKLNGQAEVFYRPSSIKKEELIVHRAGEEIKNKNPKRAAQKPTRRLDYDIVKDRRYSQDKFMLHTSIIMNFGAEENVSFNDIVNGVLRNEDKVNVIGIDRGERNLLYVVVIDPEGKILEQRSLNCITDSNLDIETDYHRLLDEKESDRKIARRDWTTIENIKELKAGYLSQVVHIVAELVLKYNAIICLEDLNFGFKRGRQKVEKQVYQKFEKMLIDKLNYLVMDKSREQLSPEKISGALNALQLTPDFKSFKVLGKQTGIIYYVPAYLTSKIDPMTGFANLFYVKYENVDKAKEFFSKFDSIKYNKDGKNWNTKGYFEFAFDYKKFTDRAYGRVSEWTVCTVGERIIKFKNKEKNNSYDDKVIDLTNSLKELFDSYKVTYESEVDLKDAILAIDDPAFYRDLTRRLQQTLQMRNSSCDGSRDYIISPVKNSKGEFFCSDNNDDTTPNDADANGAFNIARKGLWVLNEIRNSEEGSKINLAMSNAQWLEYAQDNTI
ncbi:type V CRISPR-associated protein Cas12a/Cpf1 [Butyrivibrio fibrisolvens]|uniref:type V CRISPR-associated protein Cas12a/Cpf1 n=1 Tax=Butyrivibrio fibrisolvens TaxID=831 RepID=UPI0003FFC864|nr:type V CRISPR-associated protein Cas12a/Cpf1 [Butyrivibrio fibrisolvens]